MAIADGVRYHLKRIGPWSKTETDLLSGAIAECTQKQPAEETWTGDELLVLAIDIADAMQQGLWGIGSGSEDGLNGVRARRSHGCRSPDLLHQERIERWQSLRATIECLRAVLNRL